VSWPARVVSSGSRLAVPAAAEAASTLRREGVDGLLDMMPP
jgi:hypothetical protein